MRTEDAMRLSRLPYEDLGQGLYVITTEDGFPCKVGVTADLSMRLAQIQVGNWVPLRAHWFSFCFGPYEGKRKPSVRGAMKNGAFDLEFGIHARLKQLDAHLSGEWFAIEAGDCVSAIKKIAEIGGYRLEGIEVLENLKLYNILDKRQFLYFDSMINAEQSARRAIGWGQQEMLDKKNEGATVDSVGS